MTDFMFANGLLSLLACPHLVLIAWLVVESWKEGSDGLL